MTDQAVVHQVSQIQKETVEGTPVPANLLLAGMGFEPAINVDIKTYAPMGFKYDTVSALNKEWTVSAMRGVPTFDELGLVFAGIVQVPVTTTPGGGTVSRQHVFTPKTTRKDSLRTYTCELGNGYGLAERFSNGIINAMTLAFSKNAGNTLEGSILGTRLTPDVSISGNEIVTVSPASFTATAGTFTLTFGAQTTAGIAFNASAAVVQAALEALSTIGAGNIYVSSGTGFQAGGTPYVLNFVGALAQTDVGVVTGTGTGLTPSLAITAVVTTAGSAPTVLPLIPVLPTQVDVYIDPTSAALGTTKQLRDFVVNFQYGDRKSPIWPLNTAKTSFDGSVELKPRTQIQIMMANDEVGRSFLPIMRAGSFSFMRLLATGAVIEAAIPYKLQVDAGLLCQTAPDRGELDGLSTLQWTFSLAHNATYGKAFEATLVNTTTSY